mgnify:CR=1 FL=1
MNITLLTPPRVVFGRGVFSKLGQEAAGLGRVALVVTGRSAARASGALDAGLRSLAAAGVQAHVFDAVEHDPSLATVDNGLALARETRSDVVIGLGGGSALDAAKAIAALAPAPCGVAPFFSGGREIAAPGLPFVAIPTTAGTGAEMTRNSVLTDTATHEKKSLRSPHMVARVALVDPDLTLACPPELTAHSGMDALTQAVECFISKAATPVSDALALPAAGILFKNLAAAVRNGQDAEVREAVALGSMMSGLAFANAGLGAVHGLAHPIGAQLGLAHGLVCACLLAPVVEFNAPACPRKMAALANEFGLASASGVPAALRALATETGVPASLAPLGLNESRFPAIIAQCRSGSMAANPRPVSDEEAAALLRQVSA